MKWPFISIYVLRRSVFKFRLFTIFKLHIWPSFNYMSLENLYKITVSTSLMSQGN